MTLSNSKGKTKILIWAPLGSGTHYWGPGISAYNLFRLIDPEQFEIHLAHGYQDQAKYDLFESQFFIRELQFGAKISMVLFLKASYSWMKQHAANYDVIYCLSPHHIGILPSVWFKRFGGKKAYIKMTALNDGFNDNSFFSKLLGLPKHRLKLAREIDGFIALSQEIVNELLDVGIPSSQVFKITNGVNTHSFIPPVEEEKNELRKKNNLKSEQFVILFTGGITRRKGPSLILSAIVPLIEDYPELMLFIIGPQRDQGQEMQKIRTIMEDNPSLGDHVRIMDHLPNIEEYYKAADIFILPSSNEGMSNSVLEALSSGLPAIVSPVSGSADMITNGENGLIVPRTAEDLRNAILDYLQHPEKLKKQSKRAREIIEERFDGRKIIQKHQRLFADI